MSVEKTNNSAELQTQAAARALAEKKRSLEAEENALEVDRAKAARDRQKAISAEREKTEESLVQISKEGARQMESLKKLNSERVRMLNENTQKNFDDIAQSTADEIRRLQTGALGTISDTRRSTMERVQFVEQQQNDPFYRLKSLNPLLSETDKDYKVKLALPEHEAKNLLITGEGKSLNLSLARRFQEKTTDPNSARTTKTNNYQTIVEQLHLPGEFDPKGIKREFADGVLTFTIPKLGINTEPT